MNSDYTNKKCSEADQVKDWHRRAMAELKQITIVEIERSQLLPRHVGWELLHVLEIGWTGELPESFKIDNLSELLQRTRTLDRDRLRFAILTGVVYDPRESSEATLPSALETFLNKPGELQDRVLKARALVTNVSTGEQAEFRDPEFIRSRAFNLSRCFAENRVVLIDAIVNAVSIWASAHSAVDTEVTEIPVAKQTPERKQPTATEQRRTILRKHFTRGEDFQNKDKVTEAFRELDEARIPLPDKTVNSGGRKKRKSRKGTWTQLLKNRTWSKVLGPILIRDLFPRAAPTPKKEDQPRHSVIQK